MTKSLQGITLDVGIEMSWANLNFSYIQVCGPYLGKMSGS